MAIDRAFSDDFWEQSEYADSEYVSAPFDKKKLAMVERALGYRLPKSYVELMTFQNGGIPKRTSHRTKEPTSWAPGHVAITGIFGIGEDRTYSLLGELGSTFMMEEWEYPAIGIYFADTPSAGHDMLCLDYSECGPDGEPRVVHVDQGEDFKVTLVAPDFESFVRGLEPDEAFDDD